MASDLFKKYIWLADTIRRAGPITFAEINERWQRSTLSNEKRLALRTFHNHREAIEELFGICIACDERTNRYYIANSDDLQRDSMANWLLDSFSVSNMLRETQSLRNRILVENIPSSKSFLTDILEAMRENRQIGVAYQPFYGDTPFELMLRPLFVKLYERRWYLYADKPYEAKIKLYALDRMQAVRLTEKRFTPISIPGIICPVPSAWPFTMTSNPVRSGSAPTATGRNTCGHCLCTIRSKRSKRRTIMPISNIGSLLLTSFTGLYWHSISILRYCRRSPCEMKQSGSSTR